MVIVCVDFQVHKSINLKIIEIFFQGNLQFWPPRFEVSSFRKGFPKQDSLCVVRICKLSNIQLIKITREERLGKHN